ncbi:MAG TPA: BatA domain-containing protein [Gemmatimonadaceae bacterium]|nr:BatA domain-containing protein [Gemmatimonadaceae bacterium]
MSLTLLAPLFLLGLLAVAVPIIVHLVNRERRNAIAFPSLMFLRRVPFRSVRRQRIRHWALFAMRVLALVLLALAFARPFLDRQAQNAGAGGAGPRELVVLLDRSYSMAYGDRWARATAAAERALSGLGGADQASLVLFDHEATAAAGPTGDVGILRAALQNARPGAGSTRYSPALGVAQQLVDRSERPRREVVVISDFQRAGWDGQDLPRLAAPATLTTVDVGDSTTSNTLVTGVDVTRDARDGVDRAIVAARLARKGARPVPDARVTLELNGREVEAKRAALPASGAASVTFASVAVPDATTRGTVRVSSSDDRLSVDDVFHFVIARAQVVSVLVIENPGSPAARTMFLPRALSIGDRPTFRVVQRRSGRVTAADVDGVRVVILHDVGMPAGAVGDRIWSLVRGGGGLIVALGEHNGARAWSGAAELLPGAVGEIIDRSAERGGSMGSLDRGHPALESFRAARSGDFTSARYLRYRSLSPTATDAVLARFDDGTVALAERRVGDGRVLVFSSTVDGYWNDLPVQPVFLPLVQSLVRHAAGWTPQRPWETVGQVLALSEGRSRASAVAVAPSGERTRWTEDDSVRSLALREQGFYEVRDAEAVAPSRIVAVNPDPAESELGAFPADELSRAVAPPNTATGATAGATTLSVAERERRQTMWWYVLVAALLLLAAESLLSNRLSRSARPDMALAEGRMDHA